MPYIEKTLGPEEFVVEQAEIHWKVLIGPALFAAVFILPSFPLMMNGAVLTGIVSLAIGIAIMFLAEKALIDSVELFITNIRVISKSGWISTSARDLFVNRIEGVSVEQGILGRLLGYGNVVVRGTGGGRDVFRAIGQPFALHRSLQEQIFRMDGIRFQRHQNSQSPGLQSEQTMPRIEGER